MQQGVSGKGVIGGVLVLWTPALWAKRLLLRNYRGTLDAGFERSLPDKQHYAHYGKSRASSALRGTRATSNLGVYKDLCALRTRLRYQMKLPLSISFWGC